MSHFEDPSEASNEYVQNLVSLLGDGIPNAQTSGPTGVSVSLPFNAMFSCWEHTAPMILLQSFIHTLKTSDRLDYCFPFLLSTTIALKLGAHCTGNIVHFLASLFLTSATGLFISHFSAAIMNHN